MQIQDVPVQMEVDTGAALSIMSHHTYQATWTEQSVPPIQSTNAKLRTYTGETIDVVGAIDVDVKYQSKKVRLSLLIVKGDGPTLMGRDWLQHFRLDWARLHKVDTDHSKLEETLAKHSNLFKDELGKISGTKAKLYMKPDAKPKFCRARQVPFAIREKVEQEIDRQVEEEILEPVKFSEWATPVVPIIKKDGSIRLCGDYKVTVNQATETDTYPLPRIEDLLTSLAGGIIINTHKGLYRVN